MDLGRSSAERKPLQTAVVQVERRRAEADAVRTGEQVHRLMESGTAAMLRVKWTRHGRRFGLMVIQWKKVSVGIFHISKRRRGGS